MSVRSKLHFHVTQMIFDSFKEELTYKYGYNSGADTTEDEMDEVDNDANESEKNHCDFFNFKGKTVGGLKIHVTRKHREK